MKPVASSDYSQILSQFIALQITILGSDVVFMKLKNISGLEVEKGGQVKKISGDAQAVLESVSNQFMAISDFSVKQVMEQIVQKYTQAPQMTTPVFATTLKSEQERALESFTHQNHSNT